MAAKTLQCITPVVNFRIWRSLSAPRRRSMTRKILSEEKPAFKVGGQRDQFTSLPDFERFAAD
jgi:hypothetical protein